jgi:hypothetical protein
LFFEKCAVAESSLSLTYQQLYSEVSDFLGTGITPTGDDAVRAKRLVNAGYRTWLAGTVPGETPHKWSFLENTATLTLVANQYYIPLPDDFGTLLGCPKFAAGQAVSGGMFERSPDHVLALREGQNGAVGTPREFAVLTVAPTSASVSERRRLIMAPTPVAGYQVVIRYRRLPGALVNDTDVPLGAQLHSDTILEACLATAEQRSDDNQNLHTKQFLLKLAQAIALDRANAPKRLGPMRSDDCLDLAPRRSISFNGTPLT